MKNLGNSQYLCLIHFYFFLKINIFNKILIIIYLPDLCMNTGVLCLALSICKTEIELVGLFSMNKIENSLIYNFKILKIIKNKKYFENFIFTFDFS